MVEGRSTQAFKQWLADRPQAWCDAVGAVAMDGFTGFKTATAKELPDAVPVMDPFHVVRLARRSMSAAGGCSRPSTATAATRVTPSTPPGAPCTPAPTCSQTSTRTAWSTCSPSTSTSQATWRTYQPMIAAYREPDRKQGRTLMGQFIASLSSGVPTALTEIVTLGRTLKQCAADVLAYFERPGTANGPTEASTAASSTSAAPRSASATSPTTSPDPCSTPAASGPDYTLDHEEPHNGS
jgi:transposase